jgi:hypothetical protein
MQVHEALQSGEEQLLANADDLLDACDADAGEPHADPWEARLDVIPGALSRRRRSG